ncbi:cytochrome P450 [Streptomyces naphthomycinicus]|uniref:cytochrome P450 n=1 Tax=Streptomyces naphthomycinicus TaxID=2872625 RepID=UPI00288C24AD|nr:cytochrome P450 [Streptomyces sp. TML10]
MSPQWPLAIWVSVQNMVTAYGPDHARLRRPVASAFTQRRVAGLRGQVERLTGELLDALAKEPAGRVVDLRERLAYPLPNQVMCDPVRHGEDADRFDVARPTRGDHFAFGHGVHHCLGATLARMEASVALSMLFERFPAMSLAVPADRVEPYPSFISNGHKSLPVLLAEPAVGGVPRCSPLGRRGRGRRPVTGRPADATARWPETSSRPSAGTSSALPRPDRAAPRRSPPAFRESRRGQIFCFIMIFCIYG